MFITDYQELMDEPISKDTYKNFVHKWRRTLVAFETLKYDAMMRKSGIVVERKLMKKLIAKGQNNIPDDFILIDNGPLDEKLLRRYQSDSQCITNALRDLHDLRTYGKILYHKDFVSEAAAIEHEFLLNKREQDKALRKKERLAKAPSPEERERLRAEKRAKWRSANGG